MVMPADAKPGDFLLAHMTGTGGKLIRLLQGMNGDGFTDHEHAALYIGGGAVVEMWDKGIRLNKAAAYNSVPSLWSTGIIVLAGSQRDGIIGAAQRYMALGIGYSWADYAALAYHHFHVPIPSLQQYIANSGSMICSQLVDRCYSDAGVHLFRDNRWPGYVTPGDLAQLLKGHQDNEA